MTQCHKNESSKYILFSLSCQTCLRKMTSPVSSSNWLGMLWLYLENECNLKDQGWIAFAHVAVIPFCFFYMFGLLLFLIDYYSSEGFKSKYKIQNKIRITMGDYKKALLTSIINWVFVAFPYLYICCFYLNPMRGNSTGFDNYPSVAVFFRDIIVSVVVEDILFYFSHRLLHSPKLYTKIHKQHHTFTAPFGIAAVYAHPFEHLLSNVFPLSVGPFIMGSHPSFMMLWGLIALFNTMVVHSGYSFPIPYLLPEPYFHDYHHEFFNECFGAGRLCDYIFGTDRNFQKAYDKGLIQVPRDLDLRVIVDHFDKGNDDKNDNISIPNTSNKSEDANLMMLTREAPNSSQKDEQLSFPRTRGDGRATPKSAKKTPSSSASSTRSSTPRRRAGVRS